MNTIEESVVVIEQGEARTLAILHRPPERSGIGVVIAIGGPQYRVGSHRQFVQAARVMAGEGHTVMRFDFVGMGDSDGEWRSFESVGGELAAAVQALCHACPDVSQVVLFGLCDAASAIMMNAAGIEQVSGVVLLNPWARTEEGEAKSYLKHYYLQRLMQRSFWKKVLSGGFSPTRSLKELGASVSAASGGGSKGDGNYIDAMCAGLERFSGPVLFVMSGKDLTAREFDDLAQSDPRWQKAMARPGVAIRRLPDADHTFSASSALTAANAAFVHWLANFDAGQRH